MAVLSEFYVFEEKKRKERKGKEKKRKGEVGFVIKN